MQDSDDYWGDDIELDDATLAVLDEEENKFQRSQTRPPDAPPPPKRQKVVQAWPTPQANYHSSQDDSEDLPEISVRGDGSYSVSAASTSGPSTSAAPNPIVQSRTPVVHVQKAASVVSAARPQAPALRGRSHSGGSATPSRPPRAPQYQAPGTNRQVVSTRAPISQVRPNAHVRPSPAPVPSHGPAGSLLQDQFQDLQRQLAELRQSNEKIQRDYHEALDTKLAKEGEVTILRKSGEKAAQTHADQLAKLKIAKAEADAKIIQMQKDFDEEMERMKTQFTFKQHELQAAMRKPPGTVRSTKVNHAPPPAPIPPPSQMRAWNQNLVAGHSQAPFGTPNQSRFGETPRPQRPKRPPALEPPRLPDGFQTNQPATPSRKQSRLGKTPSGNVFGESEYPVESIQKTPTRHRLDNDIRSSPPKSSSQPTFDDQDVFMNDFPPVEVDIIEDHNAMAVDTEDIDVPRPPDPFRDLHRLMLTHISSQGQPTFQLMMQITDVPANLNDEYASAITQLLEVLSSTSERDERTDKTSLNTVCDSLLRIVRVSLQMANYTVLAALFNLLSMSAYSIPEFCSSLLAIRAPESDDPTFPKVFSTLYATIREHLTGLEKNDEVRSHEEEGKIEDDDRKTVLLGEETMRLMEAICWSTPKEQENRLMSIITYPSIIPELLKPGRPCWFLIRSVRILLWLSIRSNLARTLLSSSNVRTEENGASILLPIERVAYFLYDDKFKGPEADSLKVTCILYFASLSASHAEANAALASSPTLVPGLMMYLAHISPLIWEGDEDTVSRLQISQTIRTINQTIFLLYTIIFGVEPVPDLRLLLEAVLPRPFNGLLHAFIVVLGRTSYADLPDWIETKDKLEMDQLTDMSRELLELVVDGPEGDSIWGTYQDDDNPTEVDDEEAQARMFDANEL